MLTLKTKEVFDRWIVTTHQLVSDYSHGSFYKLPLVCQQALVVEFFDSVNYIIQIDLDETSNPKYQYRIVQYEYFGNYETIASDGLYRTRPQALSKAIEKADELFNLKNE